MTPAEALDSLRRQLAEHGEDVFLRRYSGTGPSRPSVQAKVRARVMGYAPQALVGSIKQRDSRVIAINDPSAIVPDGMVALATLLPLRETDKIVIRGTEQGIGMVDDRTRSIAGVVIGLEIQAIG